MAAFDRVAKAQGEARAAAIEVVQAMGAEVYSSATLELRQI